MVSVFKNGNAGEVIRNTEALIFHFPWFNGEPESAIRLGDYKLIKNIDSKQTWLFDLSKDIEESNDLSSAMPTKTNELEKLLSDYLEKYDAENVMDLRKVRRAEMVEKNIPDATQKILRIEKELIYAVGDKKIELEEDLKNTKRYLKWLKGEVVFTDERAKLHIESEI